LLCILFAVLTEHFRTAAQMGQLAQITVIFITVVELSQLILSTLIMMT